MTCNGITYLEEHFFNKNLYGFRSVALIALFLCGLTHHLTSKKLCQGNRLKYTYKIAPALTKIRLTLEHGPNLVYTVNPDMPVGNVRILTQPNIYIW